MKRFARVALLSGIAMFAAGCSKSAPKCSDQTTIDLVFDITKRELQKTIAQEAIDSISLSLHAIRTTSTDDKTGAQSCAAQLVMKGERGEAPIDITYKSERTDKDNQQIVTVWGL